jgi:predicted metal-dependent hydrolase
MVSQIQVGDIAVDVILKDIKNVHLSVHPPEGRVSISAPNRMSIDTVRLFAISKLDWVRRQQTKLREQERETRREYVDRESHYVWGRRYLLKVAEENAAPAVKLEHSRLVLRVRPGADVLAREAVMAGWYRQLLRAAVPSLVEACEARLSVELNGFFVQRMKTKWGSCNPSAKTIRLNTELAKKPRECLEYVVMHEMVHLNEPTHNARFVSLMDEAMPQWRMYRDALNRLPVRRENWGV